ncbi:MAG: cellulose synthase/poly-beta-1,6-N-acetylglucosamine synthase-like glycosyltransferase [Myxococcota bacterium]|jgi:cellulose synthase/poly-beta-1,6-N-acetylglucosamine synthase-like glycosyltransferase
MHASWVDAAMVCVLAAVGLRWGLFLLCAVVDHIAQRRRQPLLTARMQGERPEVVVLIPAYREAFVIARTVEQVLASDYPNLSVIVIDDGSPDDTVARVRSIDDPRVRVVRLESNQGKSQALNRGVSESTAPFIVTVDADTWLAPDAVSWMVASLVEREASAVATNVAVGNRLNLWTRWQSLEYVSGLNIDRRAQAVLGVITTVPGAASGWRRQALEVCGGFQSRTLAEDTDMTLTMLRAGHRVVFESRARSRTEAPISGGALFRQRLRWLHGNLQCAWLHSSAWWRPAPWRMRLLALPNLWFAHLGVYLLLPLTVGFAFVEHSAAAVTVLAWLFAALFTVDIAAMAVAYGLDKTDWRDLLWAPSQRVGYPLFLWGVFAVVTWRVVRGASTAWNKLERTGLT